MGSVYSFSAMAVKFALQIKCLAALGTFEALGVFCPVVVRNHFDAEFLCTARKSTRPSIVPIPVGNKLTDLRILSLTS